MTNRRMEQTGRMIEIKKWLVETGITQAEIAARAKVTRSAVYRFAMGFAKSRNIESIFRDLGCPNELLEMRVA